MNDDDGGELKLKIFKIDYESNDIEIKENDSSSLY